MINETLKEARLKNWEYAPELNTFVEARVYDPASICEWYLIAMNPDNNEEVAAIVCKDSIELELINIADLLTALNSEGAPLVWDDHFRREKGLKIWSKLKKQRNGTYGL